MYAMCDEGRNEIEVAGDDAVHLVATTDGAAALFDEDDATRVAHRVVLLGGVVAYDLANVL